MIYEVSIDGWCQHRGENKKRWRVRVLVEADNDDHAIQRAMTYAPSQAPMGPKWVGFEWRKCVKKTMPFTIWQENRT